MRVLANLPISQLCCRKESCSGKSQWRVLPVYAQITDWEREICIYMFSLISACINIKSCSLGHGHCLMSLTNSSRESLL